MVGMSALPESMIVRVIRWQNCGHLRRAGGHGRNKTTWLLRENHDPVHWRPEMAVGASPPACHFSGELPLHFQEMTCIQCRWGRYLPRTELSCLFPQNMLLFEIRTSRPPRFLGFPSLYFRLGIYRSILTFATLCVYFQLELGGYTGEPFPWEVSWGGLVAALSGSFPVQY